MLRRLNGRAVSLLMFVVLMLSGTSVHAKSDLPDPTRPGNLALQVVVSAKPSTKEFTLHSVLISSKRRVAIINNKSVEVGDSINGATVRQIKKSHVELIKEGIRFSLNLIENDFKQRK